MGLISRLDESPLLPLRQRGRLGDPRRVGGKVDRLKLDAIPQIPYPAHPAAAGTPWSPRTDVSSKSGDRLAAVGMSGPLPRRSRGSDTRSGYRRGRHAARGATVGTIMGDTETPTALARPSAFRA